MSLPTTLDVDRSFAEIVDSLTRRGFFTGGLGAAALGLAACGGAGGTSTTAAPPQTPTTASAPAQAAAVHHTAHVNVGESTMREARLKSRRLARLYEESWREYQGTSPKAR
jgi:hypothetical protein